MKIIKIALCIIGGMLLIILVALVLSVSNSNRSIKDEEISISISIENNGNDNSSEYTNREYKWYETLEEAEKDKSLIREFYGISDFDQLSFVYSSETNQMIRKYYVAPKKENEGYRLITIDCLKKDNLYSQVVNFDSNIVNAYEDDIYEYDCVDAAVQSIIFTFLFTKPLEREDGEIEYVGVWNNREDLESMTIDNNKLDEIINLSYSDGEEYYMWVYNSSDIQEELKSVEGNCTYRKLSEVLKIRP